jgi:ATP-binding cassette subfamily B multidrug efflux pump
MSSLITSRLLPISYFDRRGHGDIMSIFTNDVDALREMLSRALPMVAQSIMTIVACLVMMLLTDLLLTGVVLGFAVLIFFFTLRGETQQQILHPTAD